MTTYTSTTVSTHRAAEAVVKTIAAEAGELPVYYGTGYAITHPHVLAVRYPFEVFVSVYPTGEHYGGTDHRHVTIKVDRNA